ncbi:ABC transporter substrate-binding protein [Chitinibacter sp. FCG-7]|uniref:ABC transporter substrate-binding protein n=1 Tax=Chitinibacter mangrovi TaxID=3153927 RepID=A0AAU7FDR8_9NEIS
MRALLASIGLLLASGAMSAPLFRVAVGEHKPPYILQDTHSGVEYELIVTALKRAGFQLDIQHMPNKRSQGLLAVGKLDATIAASGAIASEPYIIYQNMAVTLCKDKIRLQQISDLTRYNIAAFHNASQLLGADFARITNDKQRYREVSPQYLLNRMLWAGHIQVAISDINIFKHFNREVDPKNSRALCPFALFPPTRYRLIFREASARDRFDLAMRELRNNGFYEMLAQKYQLSSGMQRPYFKPFD